MHGTIGQVTEARVGVHQLTPARDFEKSAPVFVGVHRAADMPVPGAVWLSRLRQESRISVPALCRDILLAVQVITKHVRHHGLEHRHVYALSAAGLFTGVKRRRNDTKRIQAH